MLLSAVSVLVVAQSSSEIQEGLMNNPVQQKDKFNPRTGHEGREGEQRYSSTLSLTLWLDGGGWSTPCSGLANLQPGKGHGTLRRRGCMGPRASFDEC